MTQRDEAARTRCVAWQIAQTWQAGEWCRLVETRDGVDLSGRSRARSTARRFASTMRSRAAPTG